MLYLPIVDKERKIAYGVWVKWCWKGKEEVLEKTLSQCHIFYHTTFYQTAVVLELIANCWYKKVIRNEFVNFPIGGPYIILHRTNFSVMWVWDDFIYIYTPLLIYTLPNPRKNQLGWQTKTKHDPYSISLLQICSSTTTNKHELQIPLARDVLAGKFPQFVVIRCDR